MTITKFSFPTEIFFGPKSSELISAKLTELNLKKPLVVTDSGMANNEIIANIVANLLSNHLTPQLFHNFSGNPVLAHVEEGVKIFHQHQSDCIIAIGGGAAIDVAKAIGLMTNHPGNLFDYEDGKENCLPFNQTMPFLVALPTTAGTGSEVGRSTVISDDATKAKKIIFHPILLPKLVFCDPELTLNLPASITAATGMDAFSHLLESFLVDSFNPMCDGIALEGIRLLGHSLVPAVLDGSVRHRQNMMAAALMGAVAFQKGLGVTHSCAHALSTVCDLHHGLANGIMLPYAMNFNKDVSKEKFARVGQALNLKNTNTEDVVDYLINLQQKIAIPKTLYEVKVTHSHLENLVKIALADGCHLSNPRPVTAFDFFEIFNQALCK